MTSPKVVHAAARGDMAVTPVEMGALLQRLRQGGPSRAGLLSRREVEVLQCLADGMSTEEVAERLVLSPRTVQGHVQSILTKLEVRSKLEVVLHGLRHGIDRLRSAEQPGPHPSD